ncbi:MAG: hypothetical protein CL489_09160 [Acidobacteria bacterium]|nr:hypothetical protein [Acidobacteriota bacterium]|tara:strand:+ start:4049 stop:5278 length:1230 start_codon:yes stop_codon:yes gene_type:complete
MITQINVNSIPYVHLPETGGQSQVQWLQNGEKPLSGGNTPNEYIDYSGRLNRVQWQLYNDIKQNDTNINSITVKLNETIVEVNSLRDLFDGIGDYTQLITAVNDLSTDVGNLQNYTSDNDENISFINSSLDTIQQNYDTLSSQVSGQTGTINSLSSDLFSVQDSLGTRVTEDVTDRSGFEDIYYIKTEIGNYTDYDINGNVELANAATGIKSRIESISTSVNSNESAIEDNQTDITKLKQQVGSDELGSETGLELRTKVLETEIERMLSYGGIRLSVNNSQTAINQAGVFVPMVIDDTVEMSVNRNVTIGAEEETAIIATTGGAYVVHASVLLKNTNLNNQWAEFQVYKNGLPTGINAYARLYNDGRGYLDMAEPILLEDQDEIGLRVTLSNTTGNVTIEDYSLFISPM